MAENIHQTSDSLMNFGPDFKPGPNNQGPRPDFLNSEKLGPARGPKVALSLGPGPARLWKIPARPTSKNYPIYTKLWIYNSIWKYSVIKHKDLIYAIFEAFHFLGFLLLLGLIGPSSPPFSSF